MEEPVGELIPGLMEGDLAQPASGAHSEPSVPGMTAAEHVQVATASMPGTVRPMLITLATSRGSGKNFGYR